MTSTTAMSTAISGAPLLLVTMLHITGAGLRKKRSAEDDDNLHDKTQFTSRFMSRMEEDSPSLQLITSFAVLAEAFNTVFLPDLGTWRGVDLTGLFQNMSGALMGGVANSISQRRGGATARIANGFSNGFVAAYTSFAAMVVRTTPLLTLLIRSGPCICV